MSKQTNNKVAKIMKVYSVINAVVVILASIIIGATESEPLIIIVGVALGICINFLIYAGGELIDLLAQIRDNTREKTNTDDDFSSELPDL